MEGVSKVPFFSFTAKAPRRKELNVKNYFFASLRLCGDFLTFETTSDQIFFRFNLLNNGANLAVTPTMSKVIPPPKMTEGMRPSNLAATPDSNDPISFDEPIKMLFTEATLPRISSGVMSCMV